MLVLPCYAKGKILQILKNKKNVRTENCAGVFIHFVSMLYEECPWWSFSGRIFLCWDWIWRVTPILSVFIPNARKYGPEKLSIRTIITQCNVPIYFNASKCSIVNVSKYYHWWPLVTSSVILESLLLNLNRFHIPWSQINRRS